MPITKQTRKTTRKPARSARPRPASKSTSRKAATRKASKPALPIELKEAQVQELLLQAYETELGGVQVYRTAIACAVNKELKEEWQEYLEQTERHVEIMEGVCQQLGIDAEQETPGRLVVRSIGESLVQAMQKAQSSGPAEAAELVAAECVVLAETKDHQNWSLIGEVAKAASGETATVLQEAHDEVEDEEDEHLYHTMGWSRELWLQSLGLPAVLPPPEEKKDVKSMAGAAKAKAGRKSMVKKAK